MRRGTWGALGALGLAAAIATPAAAADLGGNCCADLEERIAELEATTARKGNRKVSLTIYGQVNQGVIFWDDGGESNAYVVTNDNSRTRFGFKGKAKISEDWEAGYALEIGVRSANSKRFTQSNDRDGGDPANVGFDLRDSYWYLKSNTFGAVSVGNQATATDAITEINLTQTKDFSKYSDQEDSGLGLFLRSSVNGGLSDFTWRRLIGDGGDQPGEGERRFNAVKYESPTFAGFAVSAAWGEDDFWDVALRYTGEFHGFRLVAGIGYGEITDNVQTQTVCNASLPTGNPKGADTDCNQFGGSVSVIHDPTGLFLNFGSGIKTDELIADNPRFADTGVDDEQTFWAIQAGIEQKWCSLGKTTIYAEYYDYDGGGNSRRTIGADDPINPIAGTSAAVWTTGLTSYGAGFAQGIDAAAMVLYLQYRHYEADLAVRGINSGVADGAIANADLEDLDIVFSGGIIRF